MCAKTKYDINQWIFEISLSDIQNEDANQDDVENPCICCGKKIKVPKYEVHLLTNGNLVSTDQPFNCDEDQGFFPIGVGCRNKLPNNFYFKVD